MGTSPQLHAPARRRSGSVGRSHEAKVEEGEAVSSRTRILYHGKAVNGVPSAPRERGAHRLQLRDCRAFTPCVVRLRLRILIAFMPSLSGPRRHPGLAGLVLALALAALEPAALAAQSSDATTGATVEPWAASRLAITDLSGRRRALAGVRGGLALGRRFLIGGEGTALLSTVPVDDRGTASGFDLDVGYGGVVLGFRPNPARAWSLSTGVLLGAGHATVRDPAAGSEVGADNFVIAVPELSLSWRPLTWIGVSAGGGYRLVGGVNDLPGVASGELGGPSLTLELHLGH